MEECRINLPDQERKSCVLSLVIAKLVNGQKVEDGENVSYGNIGAAILGSNTYRFYELVLYKGTNEYISRINMRNSFEFSIANEEVSARISNDTNIEWLLKFMSKEDLEEFAMQIGLARWIVSDMNAVLVQEIKKSPIDNIEDKSDGPVCEYGDFIEIYYVAKVLTKNYQFGVEVANNTKDGRPLVLKVASEWGKGLIGATESSKRLLIIPNQMLGIWKCLVPNFSHLSLLVRILKFGKTQSDFNIWKPIQSEHLKTSNMETRSCQPGLVSFLQQHGQSLPMKGAMHMNRITTNPCEVEQRHSIHPFKLFQATSSKGYNDHVLLHLYETLTQMKVCNSKTKEHCSQLNIDSQVKSKIDQLLRNNLKIIQELEESVMELNETRVEDSKKGEETESTRTPIDSSDGHPFERIKNEINVFNCNSLLPEIEQLYDNSK